MTEDEISIEIDGGLRISGWTRVRLTRGIERMPADFQIELTEYYSGNNSTVVIEPGQGIRVKFGETIVLTGYIDSYEPSFDQDSHSVFISGRSKSQDLVDCSAEYPNAQILRSPILTIVKALATDPYGINVIQNTIPDADKNTIPQINFIYGETAAEIIERICRYSKQLFYDMPDGSIILTTASSKKAASGFTEGKNIQSASARFTMNRFQTYIGVYSSVVPLSDLNIPMSGDNNKQNLIPGATQIDNTVPRNRKKYIIHEGGDFAPFPVTIAMSLWEKNRRYGKSFEVTLTTDSWRDSDGKLWEPNTLVDLKIPTLKLPNETWLISEVTYSRDEKNGTTAIVTMNPSCAFTPQPIVLVPSLLPEGTGKAQGPESKTTKTFTVPPELEIPGNLENSLLVPPNPVAVLPKGVTDQ